MKRVLFISNNNALRASFGAEQRGNVLLRAFLDNGFSVDFAYIGPHLEPERPSIENINIVYWNEGREWTITSFASKLRLFTLRMFPQSNSLAHIIDDLEAENNHDYIVCRYLQFASLAGLRKYSKKLILDIDDLPAQSFLTHIGKAKFPKYIYHRMMYNAMERETKWWIKNSLLSLFPNEEQAKAYGGKYLPNIPVVRSQGPLVSKNTKKVLFIGRMDFAPNYSGMDAFILHCWDRIVENVPDATLMIAGKGLSEEYRRSWENHNNVHVLGFVDNIISFYEEGNIVIVPITSGAGTNIKVVEALSLGKVCVLSIFSTKGFEDIIQNGENCIVYNDFEDCQTEIIRLLNTPDICGKIAHKAYDSTAGKYSQQAINSIIKSLI